MRQEIKQIEKNNKIKLFEKIHEKSSKSFLYTIKINTAKKLKNKYGVKIKKSKESDKIFILSAPIIAKDEIINMLIRLFSTFQNK